MANQHGYISAGENLQQLLPACLGGVQTQQIQAGSTLWWRLKVVVAQFYSIKGVNNTHVLGAAQLASSHTHVDT